MKFWTFWQFRAGILRLWDGFEQKITKKYQKLQHWIQTKTQFLWFRWKKCIKVQLFGIFFSGTVNEIYVQFPKNIEEMQISFTVWFFCSTLSQKSQNSSSLLHCQEIHKLPLYFYEILYFNKKNSISQGLKNRLQFGLKPAKIPRFLPLFFQIP
jgi:hypothetical protein